MTPVAGITRRSTTRSGRALQSALKGFFERATPRSSRPNGLRRILDNLQTGFKRSERVEDLLKGERVEDHENGQTTRASHLGIMLSTATAGLQRWNQKLFFPRMIDGGSRHDD